MKKSLFVIFSFLIFLIFSSSVFFVNSSSETKINFSIYASKNISGLIGAKYLNIKMLLPQTFENSVMSQTIPDSNMRFYFSPENYKVQNIYQDKYGNKVLELQWNKLNSSTIEFNFSGLLEIKKPSYFLNDTIDDLKKNLSSDLLIYINEETENIPINIDEFNYIAKQILKYSNNEFIIIYNLINLLRREINFNYNYDDYKAQDVLLNREGNREGILHLIMGILRAMSIPCRAVLAYSIPIERKSIKNIDLELKYEKGIYTFIEVYFPSVGWIPIDPFEYYAFPTRPFIKIGVALDFLNIPYFNYETDIKNAKFFEDYSINIENIIDNFFIAENYNLDKSFSSLIFCPENIKNYMDDILEISLANFNIPINKYEKKQVSNELIIKNRNNFIEIPFDIKNYYQPIIFNREIKLKRIDIPIVNISGEGRIQIYIYKYINGEISKQPVLTSFYKSTRSFSFGSNNINDLYVSFSFPENKLQAGEYLIVVKNILNTTYKGYYYGINYIENKVYKNIFKIDDKRNIYTNYNLIMNVFFE